MCPWERTHDPSVGNDTHEVGGCVYLVDQTILEYAFSYFGGGAGELERCPAEFSTIFDSEMCGEHADSLHLQFEELFLMTHSATAVLRTVWVENSVTRSKS